MIPVKVFDMPIVNIIRNPEEQIYIQNPVVQFSFENTSIDSIQIIDWNWNFGDTTFSTKENPEKVFDQVREYEVKLKYTTSNECVDSVMLKVDVGQAEISIPNVFTPNGDGYNELFTIKDLEYYMSNELMIFNPVSYTHLRAHETVLDLVCRLLLEKKKLTSHYHHNVLTLNST